MLATLLGTPRAMPPDELEERVQVLESKVETNTLALEQLEQDRDRKRALDE